MPPYKSVSTLSNLASKKIPHLVRDQITILTSFLVDSWWKKKNSQQKNRKFVFANKQKVLLVSGRVREMEEAVVEDGDIDFEFKEDLDQHDLTHLELDSIINETLEEAVASYR